MSLKHVLVHVDDAPSGPARNQIAVALARAHQARLSGLYVMADTVAETIAEHARCADLTLLGKPTGDGASLVHDVLFGSGGPVMIVPASAGESCGERVMVARNGSRESARAVKDALPILEKARSVSVVCVNGGGWPHNAPPGAEVASHLAHHGIQARIDNVQSSGLSVGDAIVSRAADKSVDLVVMGAYGHSRIREFVLGGVTKRMLQSATVPVLMSH